MTANQTPISLTKKRTALPSQACTMPVRAYQPKTPFAAFAAAQPEIEDAATRARLYAQANA